MHVAEADVLALCIDLQRRCLLLRRTDDDAVTDRDDRLQLGIAGVGDLLLRGAGAGTDVLALMAITAGALPDAEAARLAEIVPPRILAGGLVRLVAGAAPAEGLRVDEGRGLQRKADLRIGGQVRAPPLSACTAIGNDVAGRAIGEIGR